MEDKGSLVRFPVSFGAEDHENRGLNDKELRFRPYGEKVHTFMERAGKGKLELSEIMR